MQQKAIFNRGIKSNPFVNRFRFGTNKLKTHSTCAFTETSPLYSTDSEYVNLPGQFIKETEKAIGYQWTVYNARIDLESKEIVWLPKSMLRNGKAPQWLLQKKRDEIHQKIDGNDYDKFLLAVRRPNIVF
jgi:hypothetical protein